MHTLRSLHEAGTTLYVVTLDSTPSSSDPELNQLAEKIISVAHLPVPVPGVSKQHAAVGHTQQSLRAVIANNHVQAVH